MCTCIHIKYDGACNLCIILLVLCLMLIIIYCFCEKSLLAGRDIVDLWNWCVLFDLVTVNVTDWDGIWRQCIERLTILNGVFKLIKSDLKTD